MLLRLGRPKRWQSSSNGGANESSGGSRGYCYHRRRRRGSSAARPLVVSSLPLPNPLPLYRPSPRRVFPPSFRSRLPPPNHPLRPAPRDPLRTPFAPAESSAGGALRATPFVCLYALTFPLALPSYYFLYSVYYVSSLGGPSPPSTNPWERSCVSEPATKQSSPTDVYPVSAS